MARRRQKEDGESFSAEEPREEPTPGTKPKGKPRGRRSRTAVEKEIREQFQAFLGVAALMWSTHDEVCSASLAENSEAIATGLAHLCAKSKHAQKIASSMTDMAIWAPFSTALARFSMTVYEHHMAPAVPTHAHGEAPQYDYAQDIAGARPGGSMV